MLKETSPSEVHLIKQKHAPLVYTSYSCKALRLEDLDHLFSFLLFLLTAQK